MTKQTTKSQFKLSTKFPYSLGLILVVLFLLLVAVESFAIHTVFTSKFSGGNDFFVRWLGGREYLLHGTNPFDQAVAEKAQRAMFGRLTRPEDKDQAYFAYPLYTLYFFWPLSYLPYPWAQAIWMTLLQFMLLGITLLSMALVRWHPSPWLFLTTIFWGIFFYNGARAILLGQFSILVGLALLLTLGTIEYRYDVWAGVCLAITTIKPQMVFLVLIFLLLWALRQGRWSIIISFGVTMMVLVLSSMLLVPTWPLNFINNAIAYSDYVAFGTPLENLLHYLLPATIAAPLTVILSILFFLMLLPPWYLALRTPGDNQAGIITTDRVYAWAVMTTIIVGSLITFRSATTNQVILYLPLFFFFRHLTLAPSFKGKGDKKQVTQPVNVLILVLETGLLIFMWAVFATTLEGNWEHIMMHGLFPAIMFALYLFFGVGYYMILLKN